MKYTYISIIACLGLMSSCEPYLKISVNSEATASATVEVVNTESAVAGMNVVFWGNVYSFIDTKTTYSIPGAIIRIVGTDTPGGYTFTDENGNFEITLPIVPQKNGEVLSFAIEVQKEGSITSPISKYCSDSVAWQLLEITNPQEYKVACATYSNFGWDVVGKKIKCTFPIEMEK